MKIISLHIVAFGKFKNVNLQLQDGVNVLQNVNGFGKSTLAGFIRAMLYGFTYKQVNGVKDVARYAPWGSTDKFGGSMVVEHNGETYRIERFFGSTARQESNKFINEKTGKELNITIQPGEYLLGLTADSYDRSAYFPQEAVELSSNDNFEARLANLVQNSAEDYDKVQEKLRNYKKNLCYERGNGGRIYELDCEKQRLSQQVIDAQSAERRSAEIDSRLSEIANEKENLATRQADCSRQLADLQWQLAQSQPTDEDRRARLRLSELNDRLSRIPVEFEQDFVRCDAIAREMTQTQGQSQSPKPPKRRKSGKKALAVNGILFVIGVIFLVLSILNVIAKPIGIAIGCIAFAVVIVGLILIFVERINKGKVTKPKINANPELVSEYLQIARKYIYIDNDEIEAVMRKLWEAHASYQGDLRERETLLPLINKPQVDVSQLQTQINGINNVLSSITQTVSDLSTEAGRLSEEHKNLVFDSVSIRDKILMIDEQRKLAEHQYEVADYVCKLLEQAKDNLSSSYLPRLCARTSELLQDVTQSNLSVVVDRNFAIRIRENGQTIPMSAFSRGIREITLLCFRVALSELLYDDAIPFVIVDDAFVNFDEQNFQRATALLKKLASYAQVIYFTCHNRTGQLLK